ncbi:hypothetical protein Bca52824_014617 [Brassica carinata]|uniref:Uncharacterized protein n=1 Tax=Brassica carinata TaxID=52824 RepID=A0A8X7W0F9_BRACI|nr:hypothetical protein Bca52824_014617 [Brassica carinata]
MEDVMSQSGTQRYWVEMKMMDDFKQNTWKLDNGSKWPATKPGSLTIAVGAYDERKMNLELEVRMITVCIDFGFGDQSLHTYVQGLHQDIYERNTKEEKESEVWQYNLGCCKGSF